MRFFENCRPQFYFDGGRLYKDKKTDRQTWSLKMAIRMKPEEAICCEDVIRNNFIAIEMRDNRVEEIKIDYSVEAQSLEFFAWQDTQEPALFIPRADLLELYLTREGEITDLHLKVEIENTGMVHNFVRAHVFTQLWVAFRPAQSALDFGPKPPRIIGAIDDKRKIN